MAKHTNRDVDALKKTFNKEHIFEVEKFNF
jgi:hypothetical protein